MAEHHDVTLDEWRHVVGALCPEDREALFEHARGLIRKRRKMDPNELVLCTICAAQIPYAQAVDTIVGIACPECAELAYPENGVSK